MKSHRLLILLLMIIPTCLFAGNPDKVSLVDMFMGVKNSSNCVIGPQLPHGFIICLIAYFVDEYHIII